MSHYFQKKPHTDQANQAAMLQDAYWYCRQAFQPGYDGAFDCAPGEALKRAVEAARLAGVSLKVTDYRKADMGDVAERANVLYRLVNDYAAKKGFDASTGCVNVLADGTNI